MDSLIDTKLIRPQAPISITPFLAFPSVLCTRMPNVDIYSALSLGPLGVQYAYTISQSVNQDFGQIKSWFNWEFIPFPLLVLSPLSNGVGNGGAFHFGCNSNQLYVDVQNGNPETSAALAVDEFTDMATTYQGKNIICSTSQGEGMSRFLMMTLHPNTLKNYRSSYLWLKSTRPNWVDYVDNSDINPLSVGCSTLFYFWLNKVKKFNPGEIAFIGGQNLAQTYFFLTKGNHNAWKEFMTDVNKRFPASGIYNIDTPDNPW